MSTDVIEKTKQEQEYKKPRQWNVVFINDDYTTMDFVVYVLKQIFKKTQQEAEFITLEIHNKGKGIAGTYSYEIAETKRYEVINFAYQEEHPLQVDIEPIEV